MDSWAERRCSARARGSGPAWALVVSGTPNPADFQFSETPGQYTITNDSSDWYIYGFEVTNLEAATRGGDWTSQNQWFAAACNASCAGGSPPYYYFDFEFYG
jgi:hypothetical protein